MSNNIENMIVKAEFNNKSFESNASTTMSTLDKIKNKLNFSGATKGLETLDTSAKKISFDTLANGITSVTDKFSMMDVIGVTALANIANSAVNAGKAFVSSLTVDPIMTGLEEYETKMNSIKTILSNTEAAGTTLEDVNAVLSDLNDYSDQTVYNFAQMTDMIGKFSASSGELESSVNIVKGMANLAAEAGVQNTQLQSALYQTSQAMSGSFFQKMDWVSLENAGMATKSFRQDLMDAAVAAGTLHEETAAKIEAGEISFGGTLTDMEWLTTEVFESVVSVYALDEAMTAAAGEVTTFSKLTTVMAESVQSGWSRSWEAILGDKEESTALFTSLADGFNNLIGPSMNARNEALEFWNEFGGREAVIEGLTNIFESLSNVLGPIGDGFRTLFPRATGEDLVRWSEGFRDLTEQFKIGEDAGETITRIFEGLAGILSTGSGVIKNAASKVVGLVNSLNPVEATMSGINAISEKTADGLSVIGEKFEGVSAKADVFSEKVGAAISTLLDKFKSLKQAVDDFQWPSFTAEGSFFLPYLQSAWEWLGKTTSRVKDFGQTVVDYISGLNIDWGKVLDVGVIAAFGAVLYKISQFSLDDLFGNSGIYSGIVDALDSIKGSMEAYQNSVKADSILKIAGAIAIFAASMLLLSTIPADKLDEAVIAMGAVLLGLFGSTGALALITKDGGFDSGAKLAVTMLAMAASMSLLADAVTKIADIDEEKIGQAANAITQLMGMMTLSSLGSGISTGGSKSLISASIGMIGMAYAMVKLIDSVALLAEMNPDKMWQGIRGVSAIFTALSVFALATQKSKIGAATGLGILAVAKATVTLGDSVERFGTMDWDVFSQGLTALTAVLGAVAINLKLLEKVNVLPAAIGITIIAGALTLLQKVVENYGNMNWDTFSQGLIGMSAALGAVAVAARLMQGGNMIATGIGVTAIAGSMMVLALAIGMLGNMSLGTLAKGLGAIAISLGIMAGLAFLLAPLSPVIIALGAGMVLMSASVLALGAGVWLLSAGLAALAVTGLAGAAALTAIITSVVTGFALGFIATLAIIGENSEAIKIAFVSLLEAILGGIAESVDLIVDTFFLIIIGILDALDENIPIITNKFIDIVLGFINVIEDRLPDIHDAAFDLFIAFVNGFSAALVGNSDELKQAMYDLFEALVTVALNILTDGRVTYPQFVEAAKGIVNWIVEGITGMFTTVYNTGSDLATKAIDGVTSLKDSIYDAGKDFVMGYVNGVKDFVGNAWDAAQDLGESALDGLKNMLDINSPSGEAMSIGEYTGEGLVNGMNALKSKVSSSASGLGEKAMDAMSYAVSKAADLLGNDIDSEPTITPVLDLSNIQSGASQINGLLTQGISQQVGMTNGITTPVSTNNQVANAIDGLSGLQNGSSTKNEFNISELVVREDADIDRIARQLYQLQVNAARG